MKLNKSQELAEILGIMIGDGCIYLDPKGKYQTIISLGKNEYDYLRYVKNLFEGYFNYKFCITEIKDEYLLRNNSIFVGSELIKFGLSSGSKNYSIFDIPEWFDQTNKILFIRGIFDTDGCIYKKYDHYKQIQFKLANLGYISSIHKMLVDLGYNPTKIQKELKNEHIAWKFYLSRQSEITEFFNQIEPANKKHIERYNRLNKNYS